MVTELQHAYLLSPMANFLQKDNGKIIFPNAQVKPTRISDQSNYEDLQKHSLIQELHDEFG